MKVTVLPEEMLFELETGDAPELTLVVQGAEVAVGRGGVTRVPVTRIEQRTGRPSVRDIEGSLREDGSLLTATVPSHPNGD
ncbi:hypothetical protein GCM10025875_00910 [Litorihabitans aurantiacus]|uniref:Uncharacterized protein n=1 Tax=Litorihabitans aurantiacus TaxID=1930061 RepID=A0AA37UGS0_9MICO|nr:hypothetical protein GCM10025875_00910 [Litorihabitans aurantiacus]